MNKTPYANLNPDLIIQAIETAGFQCNGSLLALNSYENRVYQVGIEEGTPLIAKFYRPHRWSDEAILEEHQFALELNRHEMPIVAPMSAPNGQTLHHYQGYRFALFPRWGGHALECDRWEHLEWMGRFIGRLHAIGACRPFQHRATLTPETYGYNAYRFLIENNWIPADIKVDYSRVVESILKKIKDHFEEGALPVIRLHGDMHPGNVLWNDAGPHIVDLDDCLMGPAIQDIWMLLSGNERDARLQLDCLLEGYMEFHDFNIREASFIEDLRLLRRLSYSAWLAKRWDDPAFPPNFPWFNTPQYWQEQLHYFHSSV